MAPSLSAEISEEFESGLISSAAVAVTAGICGQMELGTSLRPINGISHILWGPQAGRMNTMSAKYTLAGLVINTVACGFWAWFYESVTLRKRASTTEAATGAVSVAALAYVTDYHLIPSRFTPGFELSLSRRSYPWLYAALAAGLFLPHWMRVEENVLCRSIHGNCRPV